MHVLTAAVSAPRSTHSVAMSTWTRVYYNNALSIVPTLALGIVMNEWPMFQSHEWTVRGTDSLLLYCVTLTTALLCDTHYCLTACRYLLVAFVRHSPLVTACRPEGGWWPLQIRSVGLRLLLSHRPLTKAKLATFQIAQVSVVE